MLQHQQYVQCWLDGSPKFKAKEWLLPGLELDCQLHMAKHPSIHSVSLDSIETNYGTVYFCIALKRFIGTKLYPNITCTQLKQRIADIWIPFHKLAVWHKIKYQRTDQYTGVMSTADAIHIHPAQKDIRNRPIPGWFDTAFINDGTGRRTRIEGKLQNIFGVKFNLFDTI